MFFYDEKQFINHENIKFNCSKPIYDKKILKITNKDEYFTIIYNNKYNKYQLYHRGYINKFNTDASKRLIMINNKSFLYHSQITCCYESTDATLFNNVKTGSKKWLLKEGSVSHNFHVFYDKNNNLKAIGGRQLYESVIKKTNHSLACNKNTKYLEIKLKTKEQIKYTGGNPDTMTLKIVSPNHISPCKSNGLYLYSSPDGINWNLDQKTPIITGLNGRDINGYVNLSLFDSLSACVYDNKNDRYILYQRANTAQQKRYICYSTSKDLLNWDEFKYINIEGCTCNNDSFYSPFVYKIKNYYLCFTPHLKINNNNKYINGGIMILMSEDGINWKQIGYQFKYKINLNRNDIYNSVNMHDIIHLFPVAGTPISNNSNQYIYIRNSENDYLERYLIREYGFTYITSNLDSEAFFTTNLISNDTCNLGLNFETDVGGYIKIEILDINKNSLYVETLNGNYIHKNINFTNIQKSYYLKFFLNKAKLFYVNFDVKNDKEYVQPVDKVYQITNIPKFGTVYKKIAIQKINLLHFKGLISNENKIIFSADIKNNKYLR
jgi:hypothetical protein